MENREKMKIAAVICELNPLHFGHQRLFEQVRQEADALVCVLSGNFVQRGEPALLDKWARTRLALESGADLVLELPLSWACAGAERFALGGVALAHALGCVDLLAFGSELPDLPRMQETARVLLSPAFSAQLEALSEDGAPFALRRERAVAALLGEDHAALLRQPNAILGVEYCKALLRLSSNIQPMALPRVGAGHDQPGGEEGLLSAAALREKFTAGESLEGLAPKSTVDCLAALRASGGAPATLAALERPILSKLRSMEEGDFSALPDLSEGLEHRLYAASRQAAGLAEFFALVKTRRYSHARIRRLALYAYLGLRAPLPQLPPYLRVLGMGRRGEAVLHGAAPSLPLVSRAADFRGLPEAAWQVFLQEALADDLYALACPVPPPCGRDYTEKLIR